MAMRRVHRYRVLLKGGTILAFKIVETKSGVYAIPSTEGPKRHLHLYLSDGRLYRLMTDERYPTGHARRHTQKRSISVEEFAHAIWSSMAPPDDPPPRVTSFANEQETAELKNWFSRIVPKMVHSQTDRPIRLLKGPLGKLLEKAAEEFAVEFGVDWNLEISEFLAYYRRVHLKSEMDLFDTATESDLSMDGRRIGFSVDLSRLLILVGNGFIVDLPWESLEKAVNRQLRSLGFDAFLRTPRGARYPVSRSRRAS